MGGEKREREGGRNGEKEKREGGRGEKGELERKEKEGDASYKRILREKNEKKDNEVIKMNKGNIHK